MDIRVLGAVEVRVGGRLVPLRRGRQQALVAALALARGRPRRATELSAMLWPVDPPQDPANALQQLIAQVRRALGDERGRLRTLGGGYGLDVSDARVDAVLFEEEVASARALKARGDLAAAQRLAEQALARWEGPALAGLEDTGLVLEVHRLTEMRADAEVLAADLTLAGGRIEGLHGRLAAAVARHPLHEPLWQRRIEALARDGRSAEALRAYEDHRARLGDELGVDPSPPLRDLHRRMLQEDPDLLAAAVDPHGQLPPLPALLTTLVGREAELELLSRLSDERLVTLLGPPGVGKTRLALESLHRGTRPGVVVQLDQQADSDDLLAAVAARLGIREDGRRHLPDVVAESLPTAAAILLDNVEHLAASAADLALDILARRRDVVILATGHAPLGIPGERVVRLGPLARPEVDTPADVLASPAAQLFIQRAHLSGLDDAAYARIAAITRALDGMPLALELAAARSSVLALDALAGSLEGSLGLLDRGHLPPHAGRADRHLGLAGAARWALSLLPPRERELFADLGVFVGTFDAAAVTAVLEVPAREALPALVGLADRSLLAPADAIAGAPRWRLLTPLRRHARDGGFSAPLLDAHLRWVTHLSQEADTGLRASDQDVWLLRVDAARGDIDRALEHALTSGQLDEATRIVAALGRFWDWRGRLRDLIRWTGEVRDAAAESGANPHRLSTVLAWSAFAALETGDDAAARTALRDAATLSEASDDPSETLSVATIGAVVARRQARVDEAIEAAQTALVLAERSGDRWALAYAYNSRGYARMALRDLAGAHLDAEESRRLFAALGDRRAEQWSLALAALVALHLGDLERARVAARPAIVAAQQLGDLRTVALLYETLARVGDEGVPLLERASAIREERGQLRPLFEEVPAGS